jgi:hypothetical protein
VLLGVKKALRALRRPLQCAQPAVEGKQPLEARRHSRLLVNRRGQAQVDSPKAQQVARRCSSTPVCRLPQRSCFDSRGKERQVVVLVAAGVYRPAVRAALSAFGCGRNAVEAALPAEQSRDAEARRSETRRRVLRE